MFKYIFKYTKYIVNMYWRGWIGIHCCLNIHILIDYDQGINQYFSNILNDFSGDFTLL